MNAPKSLTTRAQYKIPKKIIAFDVETTGLIPKSCESAILPHIIQLSFIVFDTRLSKVVRVADFYILIDPTLVTISQEITKLTGITHEMCSTANPRAIPIEAALREFYEEFIKCDCYVAHNLNFDREMITIEIQRAMRSEAYLMDISGIRTQCPLWTVIFDPIYEREHGIKNHCTMMAGKGICKIKMQSRTGELYYKSPKLVELYETLFGTDSLKGVSLHNSLVDTYACLRCFLMIKYQYDLFDHMKKDWGCPVTYIFFPV